MKVFLTGGTGQVGTELKQQLSTAGHEVIAPSREQLDLRDKNKVLDFVASINPGLIINAAAYTAVDKAEQEVEQAFILNAHLPEALAKFAGARGLPLIHYSTDYVYDGQGNEPYQESAKPNPQSVYGKSKLAGDTAIMNSGAKALILRTSWVYSAGGHNFMKTMLKLGNERPELSVVNDQIGTPSSASFIASTTLELLPLLLSNDIKGVVHLTPAGETSWYGFAQQIFDYARSFEYELSVKTVKGIPTKDYPTPAKRPLNSRLSKAKLIKALGHDIPNWQHDLQRTLKIHYQQLAKQES